MSQGFTCRFHGFSYDLEGRLVGVPDEQMFFDLDKSKLGLTPITTDVWNGFILINLDPKPKENVVGVSRRGRATADGTSF